MPASGAWQAEPPRAGSTLPAADTNTWMAVNQAWKSGKPVWRNPKTGDFALASPGPGWKPVSRPRVGLYKSWGGNMDEGWTRWMLDQFGFEYTSLRPNAKDVQTDDLRKRFDVIVFASESTASIDAGLTSRSMPAEYRGGAGEKGAVSLKAFAEAGGTLVFLNGSTDYAVQKLGVAAKSVTGGRGRRSGGASEFYCPGSLLNRQIAGGTSAHARSARGDRHLDGAQSGVGDGVAGGGEVRRIGAARFRVAAAGEKTIAGRTALIDAPMGKGPRGAVRDAAAVPRAELPDVEDVLQLAAVLVSKRRLTLDAGFGKNAADNPHRVERAALSGAPTERRRGAAGASPRPCCRWTSRFPTGEAEGGGPCGRPMAAARSSMSGNSPEDEALVKSSASWLSCLAAAASPLVSAVAAASFNWSAIFCVTSLYRVGSDSCSFCRELMSLIRGDIPPPSGRASGDTALLALVLEVLLVRAPR